FHGRALIHPDRAPRPEALREWPREPDPYGDRPHAPRMLLPGPPGSAAGTCSLQLEPPELDAADLPRERLRQGRHGLESARIGVGGEALAHEALDLVGELVAALVALRQHDERLHDIATQLGRRRNDGGLAHGRVLEAARLDLERADPVTGRDDHVVAAA